MNEIPQKYDAEGSEQKWRDTWARWDLYRFDPERPRSETFAIDTPPPTTSGELHIGHVFGYAQQDMLARYKRMAGLNVAYPMGWDNNGLPTERRAQNLLGIRPNPTLPYDPAWAPRRDKTEQEKKRNVEEVSRRNFVEACLEITREDQVAFEGVWRALALSVDWSLTYETIDAHSRRVSQLSFLDLVEKGEVYMAVAPTMWDLDDQTAVSQAEVEDRETAGAFHDLRFEVEGGGDFAIATTRPELLAACIAVAAHPDDKRYRALFGKRAITPLFRAPVPILAADHADPEKGTGILMICTFGDAADVEFWKASDLPLRQLVGHDGRMLPVRFGEPPFESLDPDAANRAWAQLTGRTVKQAQRAVVELLEEDGTLIGEPRPIQHAVKFYERGRRPLEFVSSRQWFVRLLEHKQALLEQGRKIRWNPPHMRTRYEHWVEGLNQDWNVSRQRYSGVPVPVWYPIGADGVCNHDAPISPDPGTLPVDPLADAPPGYTPEQRDQPGGFAGDADVFDTWATSSLSPQILSGWKLDPERHARLFPMDLRPQGPEIIRTWAFYTILKAWLHEGEVPWHNVMVNGWILDPDRKKMSKSKGNVITPQSLLDAHSADAIRYWAGRARPGVDTATDPKVFKVGRRLTTKIFNASRFVVLQLEGAVADFTGADLERIREPLDLALIARLRHLVREATASFEKLDYAPVLHSTEEAFWEFCDEYLELVKIRSYAEQDDAGQRSAVATLQLALRTFLRLFAPFLPYVTEEAWSWRFAGEGRLRSVHTSPWPALAELNDVPEPEHAASFECAVEVLRKIRQAKTRARKSLRTPVTRLEIAGPDECRQALEPVLPDVLMAGAVVDGACTSLAGDAPEGERFEVRAELDES
jgi:valyl-tRNA synthetase